MSKFRRKVRVSRTGTRLCLALCVALGVSACSVSSKISVKQSQDKQQQDVEIEHTGNLNSLNLSFVF